MKVHILDDWFDTLKNLPCFDLLAEHDVTIWTDHEPDPVKLAERIQPAQALVLFRERTSITGDLLARLPNLKLISQRSVYPHVDVSACTQHGVVFSSNMGAGGANYAAAELTLALMLASFRQLPQQVSSIRAGKWQMGVGKSLRGRRLGLYGYGRIGRMVAQYAEVIGMHVQCWGSPEGRARAAADGRQVAKSRAEFFASSEIVSLHIRLTPQTRGLIGADDLAAMQAGSLLVNTSRAGLIAPGALEAEIEKGRLYAAVDVYEQEPLTAPNHILLSHPNVLPTPHIGFLTEDELDLQFRDIFEQVNAYGSGAPIHVINPEVLA